jgi:GNAT superfamily N-acetyltransferase
MNMKNYPITYRVEKADPCDFELLSKIALVSKASLGYDEKLIHAWASELKVSKEMIASFISFVVKRGDQIVGFWCREAIETVSDGRLFILPQDQRKGCGTLLWEAVMEEAKRRGLKTMIWEADYKALPFYLKMGARVLGEKESTVVTGLKFPIVGITL